MLPVLVNTVLNSDSDQIYLRIATRTAGATREASTTAPLQSLTVPLPPHEHQHEFASFLAQVDPSQFLTRQELHGL